MTGGNSLSKYVYQLDADRRKISDTETVYYKDNTPNNGTAFSTTKISYGYDDLSRLTSETYDYGNDDSLGGSTHLTTDDYTATYAFDLDGNRITKKTDQKNDGSIDQTITYAYNGDNELTTETATSTTGALATYATTYSYDLNGSQTQSQKVAGTTLTVNSFEILA